MNIVLRSLFVWLLLLALPFQGLAAARMLPSVSAPAAMAAAHAAPPAQSCHHMPAAHAAQAGKASGGDHHDHHRGTCPGCCIAVALVPAPLVPPAFAPPSVAIPFRAGHVASVDPALPERPPRPSIA
ncbi:DUF2946 family protein [Massilia luteola]|uniref:DUF2946 family protein n=1 Tax=Massilia luteola TaxID=3081751 RepID=UPI002ACBE16D|nr:DUF2946 family protein [Massilia sp. Gc5]